MPQSYSFPENMGVMRSENKAINEVIKSPLTVPRHCVTTEHGAGVLLVCTVKAQRTRMQNLQMAPDNRCQDGGLCDSMLPRGTFFKKENWLTASETSPATFPAVGCCAPKRVMTDRSQNRCTKQGCRTLLSQFSWQAPVSGTRWANHTGKTFTLGREFWMTVFCIRKNCAHTKLFITGLQDDP